MSGRVLKFRRYRSDVRAAMLVEAGIQCLSEGGIRAFTVENICRISGASGGLITHHFGSKDKFLAAVYTEANNAYHAVIAPRDGQVLDLAELLDVLFLPENFSRSNASLWMALWGEAHKNPDLQRVHRELYARFRQTLARAIEVHAERNGRKVRAEQLAMALIALLDGFWIELCFSPAEPTPDSVRSTITEMLEPFVGQIGGTATGVTGVATSASALGTAARRPSAPAERPQTGNRKTTPGSESIRKKDRKDQQGDFT